MEVTNLNNGMTLIAEAAQFETVHFAAFIKAGSKHEQTVPKGTAHFLEHMLFKGTSASDAAQIAMRIDAIGGEVNAYTTKEYTCITIKTLSRFERDALSLLEEMLFHCTLPLDEIERERSVILEEIKMTEDDKEDCAFEIADALCLSEDFSAPILGTKQSLAQIDWTALQSFYTFYQPENIIISYSGNAAHEVTQRFMKYSGHAELPATSFSFHAQDFTKRVADEQSHLLMLFEGVSYYDPLYEAYSLLSAFLGESVSSPLFRRLRDELALCYNVYASLESYAEGGVFSVYIGTDMRNLEQAEHEIIALINHYQQAMTIDDLEKIKQFVITNLYMSNDYSGSRIMQYGRSMMDYGKVQPLEYYEEKINAVTMTDIQAVYQKLQRPAKIELVNSLQSHGE